MGREAKFRKDLSMPGMLAEARRCFERVEDRVPGRGEPGGLPDVGSGGVLAEVSVAAEVRAGRARTRRRIGRDAAGEPSDAGIERAPSDARLRERLDELDPRELRRPFKRLFGLAQRGGVLKDFEWLGGRHLLSVDGTGHFSSPTVHCANCCVGVEYYHQSEAPGGSAGGSAALKQDGATRNAASGTRRSVRTSIRPAAGGGGGRPGVERAARL